MPGRFEKGVCAATCMEALDRACMLVEMLGCGEIVPEAYDNYPSPAPEKVITASADRIRRRIGVDVPTETMEDILLNLNIDTEVDGDTLTCRPPVYRQDIEGEADLSEEVLRMYGYEHIASTLMTGVTMPERKTYVSYVYYTTKRLTCKPAGIKLFGTVFDIRIHIMYNVVIIQ